MTLRKKIAAATVALAASATASVGQEAAPQPPSPSQSGYAPVNGVEVYYAVYGEGDPIVLLHGGLGSIEMFGPVIDLLAENHQVIGVDLQAHGRTAAHERPMTFENMADDIADLIDFLGHERVDVMGYSTGGGVAMRVGIQHPEKVDKLILVSIPFTNAGWHQENLDGMATVNASLAEPMKATPMYEAFAALNPDPEANWPKLLDQQGALVNAPYDYSAELADLTMPTMLVAGDWDSVRTSHMIEFFELLGGGANDAGWDGAGMNANRLAILPGLTHYTIFSSPALAETALGFIDAP
jgi:pimeloyl-ACP methyl ester carboxylesterase